MSLKNKRDNVTASQQFNHGSPRASNLQKQNDKNDVYTDSDYQDSERKIPGFQAANMGAESADYNQFPSPVGGK